MDIKSFVGAKVAAFFDGYEMGLVKKEDARNADVPMMTEEEFIQWATDRILEKKASKGGDDEMVTINRSDGTSAEVPGYVFGIIKKHMGAKKQEKRARRMSKRAKEDAPEEYHKPSMSKSQGKRGPGGKWNKG